MSNWFECKVSYEKTIAETGIMKKVTEPYLVDALSFTEAEARIIEEITPFMSGEFAVAGIRRVRYAEIFFNEDADRYYRCKVNFITLDEKSGMEKRTAQAMLVQASSLKDALDRLNEGMKNTLADWEVVAIADTPLMDVFKFAVKE